MIWNAKRLDQILFNPVIRADIVNIITKFRSLGIKAILGVTCPAVPPPVKMIRFIKLPPVIVAHG